MYKFLVGIIYHNALHTLNAGENSHIALSVAMPRGNSNYHNALHTLTAGDNFHIALSVALPRGNSNYHNALPAAV